ncbi:patatin-like protein [Gordonia sp. CPCC 205333]|uniref:patatin-like protein n=1 Tax=Gordonia sp. CPCC 205333 TaxID=3140790 RepID=UPI003AF35D5F
MADNPARTIELRLAVVCYGGVALAIYMHGVTKEFHKLVVASRRLENDGYNAAVANPFPPGDTAHVYYDVLSSYARNGTRLRVVVDVISGTSAGGINGVVLGKAIACNADQQGLKELWLSAADLRKLLKPKGLPGLRLKLLTSVLVQLILIRGRRSPLSGEFMSRQLYRALSAMDTGTTGTLLAGNDSLDLYVTTTDLYGTQTLMTDGAGRTTQRATDFARAIHFGANGGPGDFAVASTPALAFAARATSSFPGAFAPVSLASFADEAKVEVDPNTVRFTNDYRETGSGVEGAWFVDGGLLDNAPFDHAVNAIARKSAESQVVRRLAYIEPDPGIPLDAPTVGWRGKTMPPRWINGVIKAVIGAKGSHTFLPELIKIRDMNHQIEQIGAITRAQEEMVRAALGRTGVWIDQNQILVSNDAGSVEYVGDSATPTKVDGRPVAEQNGTGAIAIAPTDVETMRIPAPVVESAVAMNRSVARRVGAGYPTYVRLKASSASDYFCAAVSRQIGYVEGSNAATFLQASMREWVTAEYDWASISPDRLAQRLVYFDMPYRVRRLQFVLMAINDLYADPTQPVAAADLDLLKDGAWKALGEICVASDNAVTELGNQNLFAFLPAPNPESVPDPKTFARDNSAQFERIVNGFCGYISGQPGEYSRVLWNRFVPITANWPTEARLSLLTRYLGFPLWDAMIYPIIALSKLPQYSPIAVDQFSPLTATAVPPPDATKGKLLGAGTFHFGGFFSRAWRENDYLWGRLDTVERLLWQLDDAAAKNIGNPPPKVSAQAPGDSEISEPLRAGLRAVLDSESDLTKVKKLRRYLADLIPADNY